SQRPGAAPQQSQRLEAAPRQSEQRRRVREPIDKSRTVRLANTTHPFIRRAGDKGRVARDLGMDRVILTLESSSEQKADLENLLAQQQDPSSPHYHQWLTPQQFGARFGISAGDVDNIVHWLQSQGMRITGISNGRREIEFAGTAAQIEEAFHTQIHSY